MKVLAIDTSNAVLGVALTDGETVLGEYMTNLKKNHSVRVMPAIQQILAECGVKPGELEKVVVAKGPGSYTGVRIGVTIAKTLAWSLQIPLVGISSLQIMAAVGRYFDGMVSPLFDARRGQIYTGLYRYMNGQLETVINDCNMLASDWANTLKEYNQPVLVVGNDFAIHKETFQTVLADQMVQASFTEYNPRPSELAKLGMNQPGEDIHRFVPNYIRLVEAEAKWLESHNKD
ncbi:tRNA (adenosine(37)-N6)-threonylcarbamoyltransferase complex dimerization subunit type 1 TsaB [Heyndrickxia ginsengihumi]|uniref:tRNA (adenosine(37)-N6)-threonylcarbamoyltransferase complex dimerization subunit type 1 TsaB n=1 Tax=Heyndrickxia ginsengihumi TaxID=363870 RepID=UPI003D19FE79